jgi:hypothetical protein
MYEAKGSELVGLMGDIPPQAKTVGSATSGWIDIGEAHRILALIMIGAIPSGSPAATVDAKLQQATSSGGANAKDITGAAIVQHVYASGTDKQALINVASEQLDVNGGFNYVQLSITVGGATTPIAGLVLNTTPRDLAVPQAASVTQINN